jgi:hypothetical protein
MILRAMPAGNHVAGREGFPSRTVRTGEARLREKLVLQEWGFCGWAGNPTKESKVLLSQDRQPWILFVSKGQQRL